mgnify:CR=1 FL=1
MTTILIKHPVEDYDIWKGEFDAFHDNRKARGVTILQLKLPIDDPNYLLIIL